MDIPDKTPKLNFNISSFFFLYRKKKDYISIINDYIKL